MKYFVLLLLSLLMFGCGKQRKAPEVTTSTANGYEVTQSIAEGNKDNMTNEDYPTINDKPMPDYKRSLFVGKPVMQKRATWNAALTALKAALPQPNEPIIFDYSKIDRQVNSENECLFTGDFEAKNSAGEYVPLFLNILVTYQDGDPSDPSNWKAVAQVVE